MLSTVLAHRTYTINTLAVCPCVLMAPKSLISNLVFLSTVCSYLHTGLLHWQPKLDLPTFPSLFLLDSWSWWWHYFPSCAQMKYLGHAGLSFSPLTRSNQSPDYPFFSPNIYLIHLIIFAVTCLNSGFLLLRIHYSGFPQTQAVGIILAKELLISNFWLIFFPMWFCYFLLFIYVFIYILCP